MAKVKPLFNAKVYTVDMLRLIDEGYLCDVIPRAPLVQMNTDGLHTQAGDFITAELSQKLDREELTRSICTELLRYQNQYKHWLLFTIDIAHAQHVLTELQSHGIRAAIVHSKQSANDNAAQIQLYTQGYYQALINIDILTTGFDFPAIDLIGLLRPTKSPVLYVQMVGRGMRPAPGKAHCLLLDFARVVETLGPINNVQVPGRKKRKANGEAITKKCPQCRTISAPAVKHCPVCGHKFEFKQKLRTASTTKQVIERIAPPQWYDVNSVVYDDYINRRGQYRLQVAYHCGIRTFFEYKDFTGGGTYHSRHWWRYRVRSTVLSLPISSREAVIRAQNNELRKPRRISVRETGTYPSIEKVELL